jgi:hypothetical protein
MTPTDKLIKLWQEASKDLGFSFIASFELEDNGQKIQYTGLIEDFGSDRGMLIFLSENWDTEPFAMVADKNGFGYSCLSAPLPEEKYNQKSFIDILNDWGWSPKDQKPPIWYSGEPCTSSILKKSINF